MKAWSVIGLLFAAAIIATIPISPQVTPRGVELSVDQAQPALTGTTGGLTGGSTDALTAVATTATATAARTSRSAAAVANGTRGSLSC